MYEYTCIHVIYTYKNYPPCIYMYMHPYTRRNGALVYNCTRCICMYMYMYVCVYMYIYTHTNTYTYVHTYMHIIVHVHNYAYVHICINSDFSPQLIEK